MDNSNLTIKIMPPKVKRNIQRVIPFGIIWLLSGWVFLIVELAAAGSFSELPSTAIKLDIQLFALSSIVITGVGLLIGYIELKYIHDTFIHKNFFIRFIYKLLVYGLFFFIIILITFPIAASLEMKTTILDERVWEKYGNYFTSITHLSTVLQLATSLILSLFYLEMSEYIGQEVLLNFFSGKYHRPIEEERVFMFLDMKASTTIAEKLGHLAYFKLLKAYYACFTDAINRHEGEIYQYVGDEIILSWKCLANQSDNRSIACFFAMQHSLQRKAEWFQEQFGCTPTFKAGIHVGKVSIGEIGVIKKDLFFIGDVLNTTARIQGLCNQYGAELLFSGELLAKLNLADSYFEKPLGNSELRGRVEKIRLFTIVTQPEKKKHKEYTFISPKRII